MKKIPKRFLSVAAIICTIPTPAQMRTDLEAVEAGFMKIVEKFKK